MCMTDGSINSRFLTRRKFVGTTAVGLTTAALMPVLSACGGDDDDDDGGTESTATPSNQGGSSSEPTATTAETRPTETQAEQETSTEAEPTTEEGSDDSANQISSSDGAYTYAPQTGIERDEMIVGVQGLAASVDPAAHMGNVGTRVSYTPYDTLIRRDFLNNNELVPSLALSWERVSDTVLELKLREGVTFHNGDPFTADDVVYTFQRLFDSSEDSLLAEAKTYFLTFSKITKINDYTVQIETAEPDPLVINRLASWASWIVPKNYIETVGHDEFLLTGMGTGPFKFVSFDPDNEIVLERYDGYWGDPVPLQRLVFRVIPEIAARVTALINDEVQIITNVPPDQVGAINDASSVEVRSIPLANAHILYYNTHHPAIADKKLRQALNISIDRQLIIDTIWSGEAVPKRSHQFEEYGPLYNPDRPLMPYDPDRARQLVEESSYDGELVEYQLAAGYYTNSEQVAQAIVPMWQDVGINAEVRISEDFLSGDERIAHTGSNSSILADPDGVQWRAWGAGSTQQVNYWDAPAEFNELGEEARRTLDQEKRYENYQRMLDIWGEEAPGTVLYDPVEFYGVSTQVNWSPYSFYYMDLRAYNLSFNE